jgi:aspartate/methionine/tyrosine aminotransferase
VRDRADELEATGRRVLRFEVGEPDFDTPEHVRAAAVAALQDGETHYTSNYGTAALGAAIAEKLEGENGIRYRPGREIIVTAGAGEAVLATFLAVLDPGDEVLVPEPAWPHYTACARLSGAISVPVPTTADQGFVPDPAAIAAAITPRTRLLVLNSPNNPTGAVYPHEVLDAIGEIAADHDLVVLSDEIYERLVYDPARHVSFAAIGDNWHRTVTVNGFSKAYAMTGWRLGYAAAPAHLAGGIVRVHQYATTCAASFAQAGGVAAYRSGQAPARAMRDAFSLRRQAVIDGLRDIQGCELVAPEGAFYAFPRVAGWPSSADLCNHLLEHAGVATVPGDAFGASGASHLRISYAAPIADLREGMARIAEVLGRD